MTDINVKAQVGYPVFKAFDFNGYPLAGGLLYTYEAGSPDTPKDTYWDIDLTVPHSNPVVLDSNGEVIIYMSGAYKFRLTDKDGGNTPFGTKDHVTPGSIAIPFPESGIANSLGNGQWGTSYQVGLQPGNLVALNQYGLFDNSLMPCVNVKNFGALGNGIHDDAPAIQAAIDSIPGGGIVCFPVGAYRIYSGLVIGNASPGQTGTIHGVKLMGLAGPPGPHAWDTTGNVSIIADFYDQQWAVKFLGGVGWGIENIHIDCYATTAYGLAIYEGSCGTLRDVYISGCHNLSFMFHTFGNECCSQNKIYGLYIHMPSDAPNAQAIVITGEPSANSFMNQFYSTHITPSNSGQIGIDLQFCDSNDFYTLDINPLYPGPGCWAIMFNYAASPQNPGFPGTNRFWGIDVYNNTILNGGTPGQPTKPNMIVGFSTGNGAQVPSIDNLLVELVQ